MIIDRQNTVSSAQALTTGTIVSTDTIDLSVARDIGAGGGESMEWAIGVDVAFATLTSVQPQVIISANANLSSPTILSVGPVIPVAEMVAGARFKIPMPNIPRQGVAAGTAQRYLGLQYVIVGTGTGSLTATLAETVQEGPRFYASGFSVQ